VVESIDLQRVRPPTRSELVGSHLRGDRLYGEVVSARRQTPAVRSEIGPYRRPSQRYLALPKIIRDATPMKSSFPSTDGASQVKCSERAADVSRFFARALGWESLRLDTRSPVYKRLPLFQSGPHIHISTQGSASLHPGLRSLTPSAYLPKMPQLQSFFTLKLRAPDAL